MTEGGLEISLKNGILMRNLKMRPISINEKLKKQGFDAEMINGEVGEMTLNMTSITGCVEVAMHNVDLTLHFYLMQHVRRKLNNCITEYFNDTKEKAFVQQESTIVSSRPGPRYIPAASEANRLDIQVPIQCNYLTFLPCCRSSPRRSKNRVDYEIKSKKVIVENRTELCKLHEEI